MWEFLGEDLFVDPLGLVWLGCIEADLHLQYFIVLCSPLINKTNSHGQFWPLVLSGFSAAW
jgi:hypothetical protein